MMTCPIWAMIKVHKGQHVSRLNHGMPLLPKVMCPSRTKLVRWGLVWTSSHPFLA